MLEDKAKNLPVYVYHLPAHVVLVHKRIGYEINGYSFADIIIKSNHSLRVGDCLTMSAVYPGNSATEIIPHLQKKGYLSGVCEELEYYYGCEIIKLAHNFVDLNTEYPLSSCGSGTCRIFIELSPSKLADTYRELDKNLNNLSDSEQAVHDAIEKEYFASDTLEYWKTRIKDWDSELTCIGEVPENLIY